MTSIGLPADLPRDRLAQLLRSNRRAIAYAARSATRAKRTAHSERKMRPCEPPGRPAVRSVAGLGDSMQGSDRSEERRVGTEWVSQGRSRWSPYQTKKN